MTETLPLLLILLGLLYGIGVALLIIGLFNRKPGRNTGRPFISVVIAAKNEEKTIGHCLEALSGQNYPATRYEVIVVDDRSSDRTSAILTEWSRRMMNLRWLQVGPRPRSRHPREPGRDHSDHRCGLPPQTHLDKRYGQSF
jgi:cellulose synthase/poly-beta-1,6-N-acetylglucosamine synthase-like glycosyltransferase